MKILAFDIETTPITLYKYSLKPEWTSPSNIEVPSRVLCFAARWIDEPKKDIRFFSEFSHGHDGMIEAAWELFDEADALLGWNSQQFDEKHLEREFLLADLGPPSPSVSIDLMRAVRRRFRFESNKLDYVSKRLASGGKVGHAGLQLWLDCMAGDEKAWRKMQRYNEQDVHLLVDNYRRLIPWLPLPNQNLYQVLGGCPTPGCSGTPAKRGFRPTQTGLYQRYRCPVCRSWSTAGKAVERADLRRV